MAEASLFVHNLDKHSYDEKINPRLSHINVGTGIEITIKELSEKIKSVASFNGKILFDNKLDGTPRKLLDVVY